MNKKRTNLSKHTGDRLRAAAWGIALAASLLPATASAQGAITTDDRRALADGLMSRGLFQLARPEYQALAETVPAMKELDVILYRLAECQRQTDAHAEAAATCARLAKDFPNSPFRRRADMTRGLLLLAAGKPIEAAGALESVATDPKADQALRITALYHAAEAREKAGEIKAAISRHTQLQKEAAADGFPASMAELAAYSALRAATLKAQDPATSGEALAELAAIAAKPFSPRIGAEALFLSAALSYNSGKYDEAVTSYDRLLKTYPEDIRHAEALLPAAWANERAGRYADAILLLDELDKLQAGAPLSESLYLRATSLGKLGRFADAVAFYDKLLGRTPADDAERKFFTPARFDRISALFRQGDYKRVLAESAAFADPPAEVAAELLWMQAEAAEGLKDDVRATQFYRILSERHPKSTLAPDAAYRFALALQKQNAWGEAARVYQRLAGDYPEHELVARSLFSSGLCLAKAGRSDDALRDWGVLLTRFPKDELVPETLFQKGMEEIRSNDPSKGAETLDRLLREHPSTPRKAEALFWRSRLFYEEKDFARAEKTLRECLAAKPPVEIERESGFLLGLVFQATGRDAEAAAQFQPLLTAPTRAKFSEDRLAWLSEFQFKRKEFSAARDAANELAARQTTPDWKQVGNTLAGRASAALSETNAAIASFRAAADSAARTRYSPEAALRLGELLLAMEGKADEAARYLSAAARRASSPDLISIRGKAYFALGKNAERQSLKEDAIRYYMSVAILFDDPVLVPQALDRAEILLRAAGRKDEADAAHEERVQRYPVKK